MQSFKLKARDWYYDNLPPNWRALAVLGQSRIIRSSYFWIFFVPIAARVCRGIRVIEVPLLKKTIELDVTLPFSWKLFFLSALLFSAASIIYSWRCPEIIKKFATPLEFFEQGYRLPSLHSFLVPLLRRNRIWCSNRVDQENLGWLSKFATRYYEERWLNGLDKETVTTHHLVTEIRPKTPTVTIRGPNSDADVTNRADLLLAFAEVQEIASYTDQPARWTTAILYLIAFSLIGWVLCENIFYVFVTYRPVF